MKTLKIKLLLIFLGMVFLSCDRKSTTQNGPDEPPEAFSFAFMTDIHLNFSAEQSFTGLEQAIDKAKEQGVDFIITGGDNVDADVVGDDIELARRIYTQFREIIDRSEIDIHVTIGNHDRFWHQPESAGTHG
jgi:predicted MPP superfamily phosphohydrolase